MASNELIATIANGTIEDIECVLNKNGVNVRNADGSFRRFDAVMSDLIASYQNK